MKVSVKSEKVYTLKVGELTLPAMRVESTWEGFTKLVDEKRRELIVHGLQGLQHQINETFGLDTDLTIVQGTPALVNEILQAAKAAEAEA